MDKLDIFKLLTSAYNFYQNKNKEEKNKDNLNFLKNILNPKNNDNKNNELNEEQTQAKLVPLQEKMLSTMRSHDAFVNRVINSNKKSEK